MRKISSFVIAVNLILAATAIGIWAASRTTNQANVNIEDARVLAAARKTWMPGTRPGMTLERPERNTL